MTMFVVTRENTSEMNILAVDWRKLCVRLQMGVSWKCFVYLQHQTNSLSRPHEADSTCLNEMNCCRGWRCKFEFTDFKWCPHIISCIPIKQWNIAIIPSHGTSWCQRNDLITPRVMYLAWPAQGALTAFSCDCDIRAVTCQCSRSPEKTFHHSLFTIETVCLLDCQQ